MTRLPRSIDFHAHLTPSGLLTAAARGGDWFGASYETGPAGESVLVVRGRRYGSDPERLRWHTESRLAEMDQIGTDMQVLSVTPLLLGYDLPPEDGLAAAREINDEIAVHVQRWPDRFRGLAALPLPDVDAAVVELERAVSELGLAGAELDTNVAGRAWDEPAFEPIFAAAEGLGAVLFFHPSHSLVWQRQPRYHLGNTIGNPAEDTLVAAALIFGGVLDRHPRLKALIAHAGGPLPFGVGRMDRGWQVRREARTNIAQPPSRYLRHLHYDCITWDERALRFLIDSVGADRVVMGSDWPYDMGIEAPRRWLEAMSSLSDQEKIQIAFGNAARLLGLPADADAAA